MANDIDNLVIRIKADTKQLQKELKQIEGKIKVTGAAGGAAFGTMAGSLSKIKGPALAAAAAIAAIVLPMKVIAGVGSGFEDLKDSLDQVFGSMEAGDAAMQKVFQFAQTTPFQIEDATKAFIQLKSAGIEPSMDMLQTFADTASTSIDQLGAFEALIRIVQRSAAGGMGLEEINQLDDRGIPATKILTEALGKSREELSEFGKTAEGAAEMVQLLISGLETRFGGAMENKMDNLSTKTSNMVIAFKQLADEVFKSGLGDFLKNMADSLTKMANAIAASVRAAGNKQTAADFGVTKEKGETDEDVLNKLTRQRKAKQIELDNLLAMPTTSNLKDSGQLSNVTAINKAFEERNRLIFLEFQQQQKVDLALLNQKKTVEDTTKPTQDNIEFLTEFTKLLDDSIPELDKINAKLLEVEALRGKIGEDGKLLATPEEIEAVVGVLNKMKDELGDVATMGQAMQQTIINASNAFTTDFVNSLMAGENAMESFKNFAKSIVSQIISTFLQMAVVNNILNAVFGLKGDDALTTFSFKKSAGGGSAYGGQPMIVGERGPEIFVPHSSGNIMNNMNSKNAMGGGGTTVINQSINFATGVVPTVRAEVMKMMPQIADVTKGAVAEAAIRGGSYRRMLQGG
jgi:tape measure domain-containing protein